MEFVKGVRRAAFARSKRSASTLHVRHVWNHLKNAASWLGISIRHFRDAGLPIGHFFAPNFGEASAVLLQTDRKILIGGWSTGENSSTCFTVMRLLENGQPTRTSVRWNSKEQFYASTVFQYVFTMTIQPWDNAIVVAGVATPGPGRHKCLR